MQESCTVPARLPHQSDHPLHPPKLRQLDTWRRTADDSNNADQPVRPAYHCAGPTGNVGKPLAAPRTQAPLLNYDPASDDPLVYAWDEQPLPSVNLFSFACSGHSLAVLISTDQRSACLQSLSRHRAEPCLSALAAQAARLRDAGRCGAPGSGSRGRGSHRQCRRQQLDPHQRPHGAARIDRAPPAVQQRQLSRCDLAGCFSSQSVAASGMDGDALSRLPSTESRMHPASFSFACRECSGWPCPEQYLDPCLAIADRVAGGVSSFPFQRVRQGSEILQVLSLGQHQRHAHGLLLAREPP